MAVKNLRTQEPVFIIWKLCRVNFWKKPEKSEGVGKSSNRGEGWNRWLVNFWQVGIKVVSPTFARPVHYSLSTHYEVFGERPACE